MHSVFQNWKSLLLEVLVFLSVFVMIFHPVEASDYRRYATDTIHYQRGQVIRVVSEELSHSDLGTGQQLGVQELMVELSDGQTVTVTNYLTEIHNILAKKGQWVVICVDAPENAAPYYTVYNYDRTPALAALVAVFLGFMLLVGRRKGFDAALASPNPQRKALFRAGIRLGQDMIGTMSNTLIFAFAGGALATMLVFYSYGVQFQQLISSDYLTVELAQGLCSTAAVILTVPAAALVGAVAYSKKMK